METHQSVVTRGPSHILLWGGIAAAATLWLALRARERMAHRGGSARSSSYPEWYSEHPPGPDGRLTEDELIDQAMEDSFPASDPPAYMGSAKAGGR